MLNRGDAPAFPLPQNCGGSDKGMTIREYYAAQALVIVAQYNSTRLFESSESDMSKWAFKIADAMIAESNKE